MFLMFFLFLNVVFATFLCNQNYYRLHRPINRPASLYVIILNDTVIHKNSSGDEIANVNFFTTISHMYFKIPKKRTYTSFNKLDDS